MPRVGAHRAGFAGADTGYGQKVEDEYLAVADAAKAEADRIRSTLPEGMTIVVGSDDSQFISRAIEGVWHTLAEAAVLVVLVIYLFLGSWRATLIPMLAVPVSLVGAVAGL